MRGGEPHGVGRHAGWLSAPTRRTWHETVYLFLGLPIGAVAGITAVTVLSVVLPFVLLVVGAPLLVLTLGWARWFAGPSVGGWSVGSTSSSNLPHHRTGRRRRCGPRCGRACGTGGVGRRSAGLSRWRPTARSSP
ncbi:MAG: sensor domain-containing protein [Ilumatobacteraceae bacterium]